MLATLDTPTWPPLVGQTQSPCSYPPGCFRCSYPNMLLSLSSPQLSPIPHFPQRSPQQTLLSPFGLPFSSKATVMVTRPHSQNNTPQLPVTLSPPCSPGYVLLQPALLVFFSSLPQDLDSCSLQPNVLSCSFPSACGWYFLPSPSLLLSYKNMPLSCPCFLTSTGNYMSCNSFQLSILILYGPRSTLMAANSGVRKYSKF